MTQVDVAQYLSLLLAPLAQVVGATLLAILPGWWLADRLDLEPLTKLMVAAIASFTLMYLLAFGAYVASVPQWVALAVLVAGAFVSAADGVRRRVAGRAEPLPVDGVTAWLSLAIWIVGLQSRVAVYGGGTWFGDWHEHYERALFFLDHLSADTKFLYDMWSVPARGPMFNASAALLMAGFGRAFADYQCIATVLNTFPVLPMALLLRDMGRLSQRAALVWSVVLFGIAPFAVQQEMYTWTKFFTVGFILGGIHLYRTGLHENRPWLVGGSFAVFALGMLAHYFVLPFAGFFAVHLLRSGFQRKWDWRAVVSPAAGGALVVATWFIYLLVTFGWQATVTANSTFGDYAKTMPGPYGVPATRDVIFLGNLVTTTVPYSWRHDLVGMGHAPHIVQMDPRASPDVTPTAAELNRKTEWFSSLANNPSSILGTLGFAGGAGLVLAAAVAIAERRRRSPAASAAENSAAGPGWKFWTIFFGAGIPLGILASADYAPHGVAHLNLQPYACLAAVFLFRYLRALPTWATGGLIAVFLVESALSTGAHVELQERPVPIVVQDGGAAVTGKLNVDQVYVSNYLLKLNKKAEFMSDRLQDLGAPFALIAVIVSISLLTVAGALPGAPPAKSTAQASPPRRGVERGSDSSRGARRTGGAR